MIDYEDRYWKLKHHTADVETKLTVVSWSRDSWKLLSYLLLIISVGLIVLMVTHVV